MKRINQPKETTIVKKFLQDSTSYEAIIAENIENMRKNKIKAVKENVKNVVYREGGLTLRSIRNKLGLSQPEIAKVYNVSPNTVRRWELGYARPPLHTLVVLQQTLPSDVARLIDIKDFDYKIEKLDYTDI